MKDRSRTRLALLVGAAAGSVVGLTGAAGAAGPADATPPEPAPVAVVSPVLDAFETGSAVGPGVIGGIARTVVGSQTLPPPADQAQAAVLDAIVEVGTRISEQGPSGIDALREAVAPLACANPALDDGIEAVASSLDQGAADLGAAIAPFDVTAGELATFLRGLEAPATAC